MDVFRLSISEIAQRLRRVHFIDRAQPVVRHFFFFQIDELLLQQVRMSDRSSQNRPLDRRKSIQTLLNQSFR